MLFDLEIRGSLEPITKNHLFKIFLSYEHAGRLLKVDVTILWHAVTGHSDL